MHCLDSLVGDMMRWKDDPEFTGRACRMFGLG